MLIWHKELWLIDHGACLYFHHSWTDWKSNAKSPFALIKDHVLLSQANLLVETDVAFKQILSEKLLQNIVSLIPTTWLCWEDVEENPEQLRAIYLEFLLIRLEHSEIFIKEAQNAREALI